MNELKNKDIVIIAGGIGILLLRSFIKEIIHNDNFNTLEILYGARMKCGIGKCGHCIAGSYYVCIDGSIFRYSEFKSVIILQ